jgi:hypothetical protein
MEQFELVMGMLELNNTCIGIISPMEKYYAALSKVQDEVVLQQFSKVAKDYPNFREVQGCEGTALFECHSCINHSCQPNAKVQIDIDTVQVEVTSS